MKEKDKKSKKSIILVVFLLLFVVSIGYAVISGNYNFNGLIKIEGNQWNITPPDPGDIEVDPVDPDDPDPAPVITVDDETGEVTISYQATLKKPGDVYSFVVPIKNEGSIDAEVGSVTTQPKSAAAEKYLTYKITTEDGKDLKGLELPAEGGVLRVKVFVKYNDDDAKNIAESAIEGIELKTVVQLVQKN